MRTFRAAAAIAVVLASLALPSQAAYAHEHRMVGPYAFVVGWLNEPAFEGQPNAATVRITDTRENPAKPVEGLEKALKIEVVQGGVASFTGTVRAVFGQPGLYAVDVFPTVPGVYRYLVTGAVGTLNVKETFESGPTTFGDIVSASSLQYPTKVPAGESLVQKLDAIQAGVDQTRLLAIAALVLGIVAMGATALFGRRRT